MKTATTANDYHAALLACCGRFADREAVVCGSTRWTYAQLGQEAESFSGWLRDHGSAPVMLRAGNNAQSVAAILGALAYGHLPLLADPTWSCSDTATLQQHWGIDTLVQPASGSGAVAAGWHNLELTVSKSGHPLIPIDPRVAFVRFTSGSTGRPKGLGFSAHAAVAAAGNWAERAGYTVDDRVVCLAHLSNGLAFNIALLAVFLSGATLILHSGPLLRGPIYNLLAREHATVFVSFPLAYEFLLSSPQVHVLQRLRLAISSAAPMSSRAAQSWQQLTGRYICDYYGLAEVGPCTFNDGTRPGNGRALPMVSISVTDEDGASLPNGDSGIVRVRTPAMAVGYIGEDAGFGGRLDADGYYITSDLGRLAADGTLTLAGRADRVINIEGRKIDPAEVEARIRTIPHVRDAVVFDVDTDRRTVVVACVETDRLTENDLRLACVERLPQHQRPQLIGVLKCLPRSLTGKIQLGEVRAHLSTVRRRDAATASLPMDDI